MTDVRDEDVERAALAALPAHRLSTNPVVSHETQNVSDKRTYADEVVSRLYRRFKEWSLRGFGPDDVTWCEVKADIEQMIALPTSGYEKGWSDAIEAAAEIAAGASDLLPAHPQALNNLVVAIRSIGVPEKRG